MSSSLDIDRSVNRKVFAACAVPGIGMIAFGVFGLFQNSGQTQPTQWFRWFVAGLLIHDFVIAPLVFLVAVLFVRRIPEPWKAALQGALLASGIIALATWPFVARYGRRPDNHTLLPNDYAAGLIAVLTVIWVLAAAYVLGKKVVGNPGGSPTK